MSIHLIVALLSGATHCTAQTAHNRYVTIKEIRVYIH